MRPKSILIIMSLLLMAGCELNLFNCIEGNNQVATETRSVTGFDEIISEGNFEVYVTQGEKYFLEIQAESNLIPYISTRRRDDRLVIGVVDMRCLRESRPIRIYVTCPEIRMLLLSGSGIIECGPVNTPVFDISLPGSGSIVCENLTTSDLGLVLSGSGTIDVTVETGYIDADLPGSGRITLTGAADQTELSISGSGTFRAYNMDQKKCFTHISGSGSAYVRVSELLDALISGSGNVYYKGNPGVTTTITGSGSVINDN